eukprot:jgi/Mesvir1/28047/Mv04650-RA.1
MSALQHACYAQPVAPVSAKTGSALARARSTQSLPRAALSSSKPVRSTPPTDRRNCSFLGLGSRPLGLISYQNALGKSRITKPRTAHAMADGDKPTKATTPPPAWNGVKPIPLAMSVAVGLIVRFVISKPEAITMQAWQLFAIFLSTITGLVVAPLPVGAWAFVGLTVTVLTRTLPFTAAFTAFTNEVIWLIVISFFFARGFVKTGLGDRVATMFVQKLGKSTLGLSYGLVLSEALLAPAMPSTTARAGGVFLPIINSLARANDSKPNDPSSAKIGTYLVQSQLQASAHSSALFLTAAAQNLLCLKIAAEMGAVVASPWLTWFKGALLPAAICIAVTPFLMYKLCPPTIKETPEAPALATKKLEAMGNMSSSEKVMVATMLGAVALWVCGDAIGISSVVTAMLGLTTLLATGVLTWRDCLEETSAWDTLLWFAVLVGMSGQLNTLGLVPWVSDTVAKGINGMALGWPKALLLLNTAYFFVHYLFASQTAQVGALFAAFNGMAIAAGAPAVVSVLSFAYMSNLFGALTHYSSGQAAVYYGSGYTSLELTFKLGIIFGLLSLAVWAGAGGIWWKLLGLF